MSARAKSGYADERSREERTAPVSGAVTVAAVDLGASSGRVVTARFGAGRLELAEAHRFPNRPVRVAGTLHWDILALYAGVLDGLRAAGRVDSVGIDSWGVDFGLLDIDGALLGNPVHYRDGRHAAAVPAVHAAVPPEELYRVSGLQHLPFNTIFQLAAVAGTARMRAARRLLLLPDLLGRWLSGAECAGVTHASTTGLLDARGRCWSGELMRRVGIDPELFAPLVEPGERVGELTGEVLAETGLAGPVPLVAVGSHDTASAVAGVPARDGRFAYVATGTWSLVGVELAAPVLTDAARAANFSNELGVDGTVRFLRNVMGLWLLQECLRDWGDPDLEPLLGAAAREPGLAAVVDAGDPAFIPPGDMPGRIAAACTRTGQPPPATRAATVRCILDSLALAHRRAVREAAALSGHDVDVVHVVGGGARNALLCRLTAQACGVPVVAGPVEAAALGNALVQARTLGAVAGGLPESRALLRDTVGLTRYEPSGDPAAWERAEARLGPA